MAGWSLRAERRGEVSLSGGGTRPRCRQVDTSFRVREGSEQQATRQVHVRGAMADEAELV